MIDKIINQELWDQTIQFLKDCEGKRVHIFHDFDTDGCTGGILLLKTLQELGATVTASTRQGRGMSMTHEETQRVKKEHNPERIIINDQDPRSFGHEESLRKTFPTEPILIIDHHFVQEYDDILFAHPELLYGISGAKVPSSKLIYDLCSQIVDLEEYDFLAFNGILGDAGGPRYRKFLQKVADRLEIKLPNDIHTSELAIIGRALDCCDAANEEDLLTYVEALKHCTNFHDAKKLGNPRADIQEELDKWVNEGLDLAEVIGPVSFIPINSQFKINSWVATIVSFQNPHRCIASYREQEDQMKIAHRYQDALKNDVHLGEIIRPLCEKFGGRGGGHAPAAGGTIMKEHWEAYKKELAAAVQAALDK